MEQVKVMIGNPRTNIRESKELIQRLVNGKAPALTGARSKDMIPDFSINDLGW